MSFVRESFHQRKALELGLEGWERLGSVTERSVLGCGSVVCAGPWRPFGSLSVEGVVVGTSGSGVERLVRSGWGFSEQVVGRAELGGTAASSPGRTGQSLHRSVLELNEACGRPERRVFPITKMKGKRDPCGQRGRKGTPRGRLHLTC